MQKNDGLNAQQRYAKKHLYPVRFQLNKNTDADVIKWLDGRENKQGAFKQLIRDKIAENIKIARDIMYIEKSMKNDEPLEINLKIGKGSMGAYYVQFGGPDDCLPCLGAREVDDLTVGEILRCLYDASYDAPEPRFDTHGKSEMYTPEAPEAIEAGSYLTLNGIGQVRARDALIIWPDGSLSAEGSGDD